MSQCVRKVFYNDRVQPRPHCWTELKWCVANCAIAGAKRAKRLNQNDNPAQNGCEQNMCDVYSHLIYTKFALPHPFSCTANIKASRILFICLRHSTYNHRIYFGSCMRFKRGKLFKEVPQLNLIPWSDNISRLFIIRSVYIWLACQRCIFILCGIAYGLFANVLYVGPLLVCAKMRLRVICKIIWSKYAYRICGSLE